MSEYVYEEIISNIIVDGLDCSTVRIGEKREEIVRCRDCTYGFDWAYDRLLCELWADGDEDSKARMFPRVEPDGFCSFGKRREDA